MPVTLSSVERKVFQSDIDDFFEKNKTLKKHSGDILNWYSWIRQEKVKNGKLDLFEEDFWYYDTLPFPIKNSHNIAKKIRFDTYCVPWVKDAVKKLFITNCRYIVKQLAETLLTIAELLMLL